MKLLIKSCIFFLLSTAILVSCKKDPETVSGCTDKLGDNYNADATVDNGSCTFLKRFLGNYSGEFSCKGPFAAVFSMADLSITELVKKDEVNIIIQTSIGPLPVKGTLTKDQILVDAVLPDLDIKAGDIIPGAGDAIIKADAKVKTTLTISDDNKKLTGSISMTLITKEPATIGGIPFPAGFTLTDDCGFIGTKK